MNSKKKVRTSMHRNTSSKDVLTTPKNESTKINLLTSCRRVGLNKRKNKSLGVSPNPNENIQNKNIFVEEDLKQINESKHLSNIISHTETNEVKTNFTSELTTLSNTSKEDVDKAKISVKKKYISQYKRKMDSDEDSTTTISDLSKCSSRTNSPALSVKKIKEALNLDHLKNKSSKQTNHTLPVSINLTRCDLNALKIKLYSPEKNIIKNIQENKENLLTVPNKKTDDKNIELESNKENTEDLIVEPEINIEEINEQLRKAPILKTTNNVATENNSLEDNSDGSDFYPDVIRRKKKKILKNKQRNISKPSSSQQKNTSTINIRISANNTPCYSDSDDDFVIAPTRRDRKSSIKSISSSQNLTDEEKVKSPKRKLKMKRPLVDELNKTGHIRISENKSYTIIHRHNTVSYVKSYDNDVNFKVTESDDNQQLPVRNSVELPNKSKILERKDYITKRHNSSSDNAQILMEMPSIFTDLMNNLDSAAVELENTPTEKKENNKTGNEIFKNIEQIPIISTSGLQRKNKTVELQNDNIEAIVTEMANSQNGNKLIEPNKCVNKTVEPDKHDNKATEPNTSDYKSPTQENNNTNSSDSEDSSSDSLESRNSSETSESDSKNSETSDNASRNNKTSKSPLEGDNLGELNKKQLMEVLATLESNIKKKRERLESLQRISVYKETHNLEELRGITLQIKRGCQNALVDLVANLKQKSNDPFTMATLLEYMKIPNELVGYNLEEDKFF